MFQLRHIRDRFLLTDRFGDVFYFVSRAAAARFLNANGWAGAYAVEPVLKPGPLAELI